MYESKIVKNKISYKEMMRQHPLSEYDEHKSDMGISGSYDNTSIHSHSRHENDGIDITNSEVDNMSEWKQRVSKKAHDFKSEPEIVGTLVVVQENDFVNKETQLHGKDFIIRKADGEEVLVYGKDVIVSLLKDVPLNTEVKIKFIGFEKSKKTGRAYENFEIFTRE